MNKAKKTVLIILLILLGVFCFMQRDLLKNEVKKFTFQDHETVKTEKIRIDGSHVIEQPIVFYTDEISSIRVLFDNPARSTAKGKVYLELLDDTGKSTGKTSVDAAFIKENRYTNFLLGKDSELINTSRIAKDTGKGNKQGTTKVEKDKEYTVKLTIEDLSADEPVSIVVCRDSSAQGVGDVSIDGKADENTCLYMSVKYMLYSIRAIILTALLLLLALAFVLLPFERIDRRVADKLKKPDFVLTTWITRAMFVITPLVAFVIIQKFAGFGLGRLANLLLFANGRGPLNLLILGLLCWLAYTICNRVNIASLVTVLIAGLFGFTNYLLFQFRGYPLIASDFEQFGTAMQVAGQYSITYNKAFLLAIFLTVLWCVAILSPPGHKGFSPKKRLIPLAILVAWTGLFYYVFFSSSIIEDRRIIVSSFRPTGTYNNNGGALSFVVTVKNSVIEKPEGYSVEKVKEVASRYPSDKAIPATGVTKKTPNIIIVMNESYSDLAVLGELKTNKDYMPFYRGLKENTIKGWADVSIFGAFTANSEFETLTGFTLRFLPFCSVPYRSVVKYEIPSLTNDLKAMGYGGNIAFHPGMRDSYARDAVYPLLGFDRHIAYEDLKDPEKVRDFVSDSYDYKIVEEEYEKYRKTSKKPFYMFNVTIQNHGGYSLDTGIVDEGIEIKTNDPIEPTATQFFNLMKLSDDALREMIEYYSKVDEETVIVLYGDHQPKLGEEFYNAMKRQHEGISDMEWSKLLHRVPFMIWANYDIDEREDVNMSLNYLAPYLKEVIGMPETGFDKYLMDLHEQLPVLSDICYIDSDGKTYDPSQETKYDKTIEEYSIVQYNGLIDDKNRVEQLFNLKP